MTDRSELQLRVLREAFQRGERIYAVHYACGNLYKYKDSPVPVVCVCITDVVSESTQSFCLSDVRDDNRDNREIALLRNYFDYLNENQDARFIHWNMDKADYGFSAIANRYKWLTGEDPIFFPPADRLYDLDQILEAVYGENYVPHPKLASLCTLNKVNQRYSLPGKDEAEKAESGDYGAIQRSTSEKSRAINQLLKRFLENSLVTTESAGMVAFAGSNIDAVKILIELADNMLNVERALKRRHAGRDTLTVQDEYDLQDLLRALLSVFFEDVRAESWAPEYAGASSRIDFVLPDFELAVEVKKSRASMTAKSVGEELIADRDKYAVHPGVSHLVCLVFDHEGVLDNPRGLERDLSRDATTEGIAVTVRIVDR